MKQSVDVMAVYFPSWHPDAHYEKWYGKGFSEWELVKSTQPLFPEHAQPKQPLWGYFDESDPVWMAKQIDLAADHGVTSFMFDWYWYKGEKFLEKALEQGFLNAANRNRIEFSLMWANHTWGSWPAVDGVPGMGSRVNQGRSIFLEMTHSLDDVERVMDYCSERYFGQPNYSRQNGCPVFTLYDVTGFIQMLGGEENAIEAVRRMRARVQKNGFPGLYLIANIGCCDDNVYCCGWDRVPRAKRLGFDRVFAYNIVRSARFAEIPNEKPIYPYEEMMASHRHCWAQIERGGLPHTPVVTVGCDVTPRWHRGVAFPMDFRSLQYEPIAVGNTPERFGELCGEAIARARRSGDAHPSILINAWNEWTEGMYLLPEKQYGNGYLEALQKALRTN